MGLFGFIGKIAKTVVGAARFAAPLAGTIIGGPLGGKVGGILGSLLSQKSPMNPAKYRTISTLGVMRGRGNMTQTGYGPVRGIVAHGGRAPAPVLRMSPVMPGGAIATPRGPVPSSSAIPPPSYAGAGGRGPPRRRKRAATRVRTGQRKRKGRRLKFGSPAWRKKYLGKKRRRR